MGVEGPVDFLPEIAIVNANPANLKVFPDEQGIQFGRRHANQPEVTISWFFQQAIHVRK